MQRYRGQVPSPGRPTVAWREDRVRFWAAIARGVMTEDAAVAAGVSSPVGFRWFRHAGGVNPCLPPAASGRYLSFSEREDIALLRAQQLGVREIARRVKRDPSTISRELRRNASTRTWAALHPREVVHVFKAAVLAATGPSSPTTPPSCALTGTGALAPPIAGGRRTPGQRRVTSGTAESRADTPA